MRITELFASIQGESTFAGLPTVFVRCTGCNLECRWCDTPWARSGGVIMGIPAVLARVRDYGIGTVCLTGGEPLIQADLPKLANALLDAGFRVSVETNGSLPVHGLPSAAVAVIDVKCPGSGMAGALHEPNITRRRPDDQFKFVLADRADFLYARGIVEQYGLDETNEVLFAPVIQNLPAAVLAGWILDEFPRVRLNLQLHRFIWPGEERGR